MGNPLVTLRCRDCDARLEVEGVAHGGEALGYGLPKLSDGWSLDEDAGETSEGPFSLWGRCPEHADD